MASASKSEQEMRRSWRSGSDVRNSERVVLRAACTCMLLKCNFCMPEMMLQSAQKIEHQD